MRLFGDLVTPEVSAAAERGIWPERLWQAVEETGYPDVLADGAVGMVEAATICAPPAIMPPRSRWPKPCSPAGCAQPARSKPRRAR
jgi:hypothetical protein